MSYLERRTRKNRRAETWQQLHAWRCFRCQAKISQADYRARRNVTQYPAKAGHPRGLAFRLAHVNCVSFP